MERERREGKGAGGCRDGRREGFLLIVVGVVVVYSYILPYPYFLLAVVPYFRVSFTIVKKKKPYTGIRTPYSY